MATQYGIMARDYLARAKLLVASGSRDALFHAAFELRAGIEARLQEYISDWDHVPNRTKKEWRVGRLAAGLDNAFYEMKQIVHFAYDFEAFGPLDLFYTPVSAQLRDEAERLGAYLHAIRSIRQLTDGWWTDFEVLLSSAQRGLEFATAGTILGPPLYDGQARSGQMRMEIIPDRSLPLDHFTSGSQGVVQVAYHDPDLYEFPDSAYLWHVPSRGAG